MREKGEGERESLFSLSYTGKEIKNYKVEI